MSKIVTITGRAIVLKDDNIDTDRIIPARYLRCVTFDELGQHVFKDDRAAAAARGQVHPFDEPRFQGAGILITGTNFGSGSSREHAVQALAKWNQNLGQPGIKAIIARGKYSEIFFGNAVANGLPSFIIAEGEWQNLVDKIEHDPRLELEISLDKMTARIDHKYYKLELQHPAARLALLDGSWDSITTLIAAKDMIEDRLSHLPYN